MPRTTLSALMITTAIGLAGPVSAQEGQAVDLGVLRINSADAQALLGNDTVTEDEIAARNPTSTKDVFAGESSVMVSGGAAIAQKVMVNGIEEILLAVTIDGARQNKSAFHHTGNVLIDPALLKSVEISKGLAPADAGPTALAGAIAYETKDAADLLKDGRNFGGMASLGHGSNGYGSHGSLAVFGRNGGFEFLLGYTKRDGSDYKDGSGATVGGTEADVTDILGKIAYTSQGGHRFELSASRTEDTGLRMAQPGPGGLVFARPDFADTVSSDAAGTSILVPGLSKRNSYTMTYSMVEPQGQWNPTFQLSFNEQEIDASGVWGINESFSGTSKNEFKLSNGTLTAGFDFFRETARGASRGAGPFASSGREKRNNVGLFA